MPCFSASNIRFVSAQQQLQSSAKGRGSTAGRRNSNLTSVRFGGTTTRSKEEPCLDAIVARVYNAQKVKRSKGPVGVGGSKTVLQPKELERLKTASKIHTVEERLEAMMKAEHEAVRLSEEAERTRERFKKIDDDRKIAEEANVEKEDLFGAGEKVKLMERAFIAKQEQEEEVKRVNRIILNAKCHAIRDAQIQEKSEIEKQIREEEVRLEKLVNENAIKALNVEDEQVVARKQIKEQYAKDIRKQLLERENLRFLEAERIEEEAKMLREAGLAIKREEERQAAMSRERRNKFKEDLAKIAEMSTLFKKMLCEQEREAEMRVAAYQREKEQRERALKTEKKLAKEEFERKQQLIYMLAQKVLDSKSKREETGYLREQERIEREYRRKEKEAAIRKRKIENELIQSREMQMQENKHRQALQIAREEQDFNKLVDRLKQEEAKQRKEEEERERRRKCYRRDIIQQMSAKELERRRMQDLERSEAFAWRESERQRDANIRAVINAKMAAMRDACLPEKYVRDVEKQLQKIALTRNFVKQQ